MYTYTSKYVHGCTYIHIYCVYIYIYICPYIYVLREASISLVKTRTNNSHHVNEHDGDCSHNDDYSDHNNITIITVITTTIILTATITITILIMVTMVAVTTIVIVRIFHSTMYVYTYMYSLIDVCACVLHIRASLQAMLAAKLEIGRLADFLVHQLPLMGSRLVTFSKAVMEECGGGWALYCMCIYSYAHTYTSVCIHVDLHLHFLVGFSWYSCLARTWMPVLFWFPHFALGSAQF